MANVPDVMDVLNKVRNEVLDNETFSIRDLYPAIVWNRIPKNDRLNLGRFFYEYIKKLEPDDPLRLVEPAGKSSTHRQLYRKLPRVSS